MSEFAEERLLSCIKKQRETINDLNKTIINLKKRNSREKIATAVISGMYANGNIITSNTLSYTDWARTHSYKDVAETALRQADALIKVLSETSE